MKSTILTSILSIFLVLTVFNMKTSKKQDYSLSEGEQIVNKILSKTAKIINDKYELKPCGAGAAMPGGPIQELVLCFETKRPNSKNKLRWLITKTTQELLAQVEENEQIKKFIEKPPFTVNNIQIIIYNHNENGRSLLDPEIANAQILRGTVSYSTIDTEESFEYKNEYTESYEEALTALSTDL